MKRQIRVNKQASIAYIPKDIVQDGLSGECDAYADAFTFTIVKPKTDLKQIKESLKLVLQDIEMRIADEHRRATTVRLPEQISEPVG